MIGVAFIALYYSICYGGIFGVPVYLLGRWLNSEGIQNAGIILGIVVAILNFLFRFVFSSEVLDASTESKMKKKKAKDNANRNSLTAQAKDQVATFIRNNSKPGVIIVSSNIRSYSALNVQTAVQLTADLNGQIQIPKSEFSTSELYLPFIPVSRSDNRYSFSSGPFDYPFSIKTINDLKVEFGTIEIGKTYFFTAQVSATQNEAWENGHVVGIHNFSIKGWRCLEGFAESSDEYGSEFYARGYDIFLLTRS